MHVRAYIRGHSVTKFETSPREGERAGKATVDRTAPNMYIFGMNSTERGRMWRTYAVGSEGRGPSSPRFEDAKVVLSLSLSLISPLMLPVDPVCVSCLRV